MVKSMFAAVAGLRTHQAKMDVIGNNIANVNTWGYKAGSVSFKDTMYQSTSSGGAGSTEDGGYGGTNANQVGYGVTTGAIAYDFTTGGMSPSASALDCMIEGTGFFIVGPMKDGGVASDEMGDSGLYLSRVGNFTVDGNGYLVDSSGNYVYGFANTGDYTNSEDIVSDSNLVPLQIPTNAELADTTNAGAASGASDAQSKYSEALQLLNTMRAAEATKIDALAVAQANYNKAATDPSDIEGLKKLSDDAYTAKNTAYAAWTENTDSTKAEALKDAYYAEKRKYDEAYYNYIYAQTAIYAAPDKVTEIQGKIKDEWDKYVQAVDVDGILPGSEKYKEVTDALSKAEDSALNIDEKSYKGLLDTAALEAKTASAKAKAAQTSVDKAKAALAAAQNSAAATAGKTADKDDKVATLTNYKIQTDGSVTGVTEDGITIIIGKIALAGVQNTGGLEKTSGYYYNVGSNAGNVSIYEAGGTEGTILGNYLEMATVDLATEMTNMITTQRGFQANSKIITVTDQMLEELVNMKR